MMTQEDIDWGFTRLRNEEEKIWQKTTLLCSTFGQILAMIVTAFLAVILVGYGLGIDAAFYAALGISYTLLVVISYICYCIQLRWLRPRYERLLRLQVALKLAGGSLPGNCHAGS